MNKKHTVLAIFLFITVLPAAGHAAMYRYTDKNGNVNFTDCYECIPKEYQNQIKQIQESPSQSPQQSIGETKEGVPAPEQEDKLKSKKEAEDRQTAREKEIREQKRKVRQEKQDRIEELRKQIEAKRQEISSLRTTWMVYDRIRFTQLNQEIAGLQSQIESIQSELDSDQ